MIQLGKKNFSLSLFLFVSILYKLERVQVELGTSSRVPSNSRLANNLFLFVISLLLST